MKLFFEFKKNIIRFAEVMFALNFILLIKTYIWLTSHILQLKWLQALY